MTRPLAEKRPYRRGVGMLVFNSRGEVLVAKRLDFTSDAWQMPQGGIDGDEDPQAAALRELREEIGTDLVEIVAESATWHTYDLPPELIDKLWQGRYRGQSQKWYAMRFTGRDSDINVHTPDPEFSAWKWLPLDQLPDVIVPFKRALYTRLADEFRNLVKPAGGL